MKRILLLLALLSPFATAETIKVALAANVSYAIDELKQAFNTLYPDTKVQVMLGSTGKLTAQIKNNAPYDILMGANMAYPEALYNEGFAVTKPLVYAQGSLALLTTKKLDITKGMDSVSNEKIKKIAIANPKTAPYGIAATQALRNAKLEERIKKKLIFGESVSQTVTYTMKAADLGFIPKSSLYSPQMAHFKRGENWIEIDSKLYTPIDQGIVILKHGEKSYGAAAFYSFILSKKAKDIFEKFGYIIP